MSFNFRHLRSALLASYISAILTPGKYIWLARDLSIKCQCTTIDDHKTWHQSTWLQGMGRRLNARKNILEVEQLDAYTLKYMLMYYQFGCNTAKLVIRQHVFEYTVSICVLNIPSVYVFVGLCVCVVFFFFFFFFFFLGGGGGGCACVSDHKFCFNAYG